MKTFAGLTVLLSAVVVLSGCGSKEAAKPSTDAPEVQGSAEPSTMPPPPAPAFDDESDPAPGPAEGEPAASPPAANDMGMGEPAVAEPAADAMGRLAESDRTKDDSAGSGGSPGVTKAFGAALWKGITQGATGSP